MKNGWKYSGVFLIKTVLFLLVITNSYFSDAQDSIEHKIVSFRVNPKSDDVRFYFKDAEGKRFGSIENLKKYLDSKNRDLVFAMNGGMYKPDHSPQGLYIEYQHEISSLDTSSGYGNFYMKPNGVFALSTDNEPGIWTTEEFICSDSISFATQSGPMLVIDGKLHPAFNKGSTSLHIRNGVGILPTGEILFALSKQQVNFYNFATYFKNAGCLNALYLDGFVSRTYLPSKNWTQLDGDFGVIIGVIK